jgi:hypothetical protein
MKTKINRRNFISNGVKVCAGGCLLLASSKMGMANSYLRQSDEEKKPNPKELNYCGYQCPADCKFKIATLENDLEKKKEAFETWKITEHYGIEFSEDVAFCHGCKSDGKPLGAVTGNCTVRACAIEKGYDCCIECKELKTCDKDLWGRFPDFHKSVIKMQELYLS